MGDILDSVRRVAGKRVLYLPHAIKAMARPEKVITTADVESVVAQGEVIEDYPDDVRGHSCLMLGSSGGRPVHVVCSPKDDYLAVITAYLPDSELWSPDFRARKR